MVHTWKGSVNMCERVRLSSINSEKYFISSWASTALVLGVLTPSNWSPRWTTFVATKLMRSSRALKWSNATCITITVLCRHHKWRSLIIILYTHIPVSHLVFKSNFRNLAQTFLADTVIAIKTKFWSHCVQIFSVSHTKVWLATAIKYEYYNFQCHI